MSDEDLPPLETPDERRQVLLKEMEMSIGDIDKLMEAKLLKASEGCEIEVRYTGFDNRAHITYSKEGKEVITELVSLEDTVRAYIFHRQIVKMFDEAENKLFLAHRYICRMILNDHFPKDITGIILKYLTNVKTNQIK